MTWYTTQEEFRQAIEQGDEYLSGHGIDQNRRTHVRHLLEALYAEYREAFGSVPFRMSWRKQIRKVFVLLRLKCDSHAPACAGQAQALGISPPAWRFQRGINTIVIPLNALTLDWKTVRSMFQYMGDDRRTFIRASAFRFLTMGLAVIEPLLSAMIIAVLSASQVEKLLLLAALVLARSALSGVLTFYAGKMLRQSYSTMIRNMRFAIAESVLKVTTGCMDRSGSGVFSQRLISDTENCAENLDELLGEVTEIFRLVSLIISFGIIDLRIMLFEILVVSVYFVIQRGQSKNLTNDGRKVRTADEVQLSFIGEMVKGHRDIKLLHCEPTFLDRMKASISTTLDLIMDMRVKSMRFIMVRTHFSGFSEFVFLAIMAAVMAQGRLEPATALVLYNYNSQMSSSGVRSVSEITNTVFNLGLSAERIWQLMCSVDYEQEVFGERTLPEVRGDLEIRDVGFTYDNVDNRVTVLKHLSLSIRAGESVAFVGKSGCGKSTILSLITRLYDPEEGEILLDGVPVRELTQDSLRGNISMVSQTPYIFNMSIRDNLRLVDADMTDEEMIRACRIACIHDDIMSFPMGYDTQAGEGGVTLSGGQRQRIALARSILRNDPVILMDEATSALDNETQARIHQAVENMRGHHTLIMVAHRLSTVIGCDRLFLIENGRVAATGTHEQLMKASEAYRRLYRTEARAAETEQGGEMGPA